MIVHHYFPLGSDNVGDLLVARAIRTEFVRHFGRAEFIDMPANDRYPAGNRTIGLTGDNIDRTNAEADLVLVGGSNMLEPRKPRRAAAADYPWGVFTDSASLRRLRVPLVTVGMGTGSSFGKRIRAYQPRAAEEIRLLFGKATATAVRDTATVRELARIGVATECTGCPVTFLTPRPIAAQHTSRPLLVSFPPSRIVKRWFGRGFLTGAMRYVADLKRRGVPVVVTLHEARDREIVSEFVPPGVPVFYTEHVDELIDRFDDSCGVIGFRLHAALLGLGLGKPVLPVGVDWRGLAFIETFGVDAISIRPFRFGQFRKLATLTDRLLAGDRKIIETLDAAKSLYRTRYERWFADAAAANAPRRVA